MPLLYYPGHLGASPRTTLRDPSRAITWDRDVKKVPDGDAEDLLNFGGFVRAVPFDECIAQYGAELTGVSLHTATYYPRDGEPVVCVPLTAENLRMLRAARSSSSSTAPTPKKTQGEK